MLKDFQSKVKEDQEKQEQKREEVMCGKAFISLDSCAGQIYSIADTSFNWQQQHTLFSYQNLKKNSQLQKSNRKQLDKFTSNLLKANRSSLLKFNISTFKSAIDSTLQTSVCLDHNHGITLLTIDQFSQGNLDNGLGILHLIQLLITVCICQWSKIKSKYVGCKIVLINSTFLEKKLDF